ncbi:MAG: AmmeMemoRadiSam system protein B [Planctomycetia bacterium]|jgi:AmmeMemoRadiSam system protein B
MKTLKILSLFVMLAGVAIPAYAEETTTRPVRDRSGYCWDATQMDRFVASLKETAPESTKDLPPLVAGISPHADYRVAGRVYYPLYQKITAPEVVIFGVTHRKTREKLGQPQDKLIFDTYTDWQGPYGKIRVSPLREYLQKQLGPKYCMVSDEAHRMDHSIEGLLPFLQNAKKDVRITPILVTAMSFDTMETVSAKLADAMTAYMKSNHLEPGRDIFFLISADANHYGKDFNNLHFGEGAAAHEKATAHDRQLMKTYLQGPITTTKLKKLTEQLWGKDFKDYGNVVWCGQYTIPFGLLTIHHVMEKSTPDKPLLGHPFSYGDSYTDSHTPSKLPGLKPHTSSSLKHWFGYLSAGFYVP